MQSIRVGRPIPSQRPVVDSSYDVGIVMTFRDAAALKSYIVDPRHQSVVEGILKPLAERYTVFDFTHDPPPR